MKNLILSLSAILVGLGLISAGNGFLNISVPAKATQLGFSPFLIGILTTTYYLGFLLGCFGAPRVVKKVGHIRSFTIFAAFLCIAAIGFSFGHAAWFWAILRLISGLAMAGIYMIAESWLNECADNTNRAKVVSIYRMVDLSSLMLGQLMLGAFALDGNTGFLAAAILVNLGLLPVALTSTHGPAPISNVSIDFGRAFRISHIGLVGSGMVGVANGAFWGMGPEFAISNGFSPQATGSFMAAAVLAGAVFQLLVGWIADRFDRERFLAVLALASGGLGLALFYLGQDAASINLLIGLSFLWGAAAMPLYALAITIAKHYQQLVKKIQTILVAIISI